MSKAISGHSGTDNALYVLWSLFWLLMVLVAIEDHRGHLGIQWWMPWLWEGSSCLVATGWLLLQRRAARRWDADLEQPLRWFARHLVWIPLVAASFVVVVYALRHGVYALAGETYEHPGWLYLFFYEGIKLLLFASLWLGIIFGLASFASWRRERERMLTLQKHLAESQLAQLKAQLQPHFLFNALNTISSLMQVDVERADRLLTQLADLLRASLQSDSRQLSSLRQEQELLALYAHIMRERFAGRMKLEWDLPEELLCAGVPTMLLQPLLENACRHGVERSAEPVNILIRARREQDELVILVRNDGSLRQDAPAGIGLRNCRERLAVHFGESANLTLTDDGGTVTARLSLPWRSIES